MDEDDELMRRAFVKGAEWVLDQLRENTRVEIIEKNLHQINSTLIVEEMIDRARKSGL